MLVGGLGTRGSPFHVALGRRVGQDEPARGVGAVGPMMLTGSTTFFFDFDILAEGMTSTSCAGGAQPRARFGTSTSSGKW
jgi:hypothetical protein